MRRGGQLENLIDNLHQYYISRGICRAWYNPVPVKILKEVGGKIRNGYRMEKGLPDYAGVYSGRYFIFDAKETREKNRLPLQNVHEHQMLTIREDMNHGAIGFLVVFSSATNSFYVCPGDVLIKRYELWEKNRGKRGFGSIPFDEMLPILKNKSGESSPDYINYVIDQVD
jgi:recombination protein U